MASMQEMSDYDYVNGQVVRDQSRRQRNKDDELPSERRRCRLMFLSFGLLCIFQAILNVSLRLTFSRNGKGSFQALIKEKDQFENLTNNLSTDKDREALDTQTYIKTLTEERDQLKRMLNIAQHSPRWLYFGHSLYYVSSTTKTWQDSRDDCLRRDADLVIINSKEEQKFLIYLRKSVWIGLTDREDEGTWKWVDGSRLSTAYWAGTQPDDGDGVVGPEDCAQLNSNYHQPLEKWNDLPCDVEMRWICEKLA